MAFLSCSYEYIYNRKILCLNLIKILKEKKNITVSYQSDYTGTLKTN